MLGACREGRSRRWTMIGIHDSDLFWLAFIAAFVSGMA
jgi:hypothetical protein